MSGRRDIRAAVIALAISAVVMHQIGGWYLSDRLEEFGPDYGGCAAARSAGVAPLLKGQAGYRSNLDPDGDGIACEPSGAWSLSRRNLS